MIVKHDSVPDSRSAMAVKCLSPFMNSTLIMGLFIGDPFLSMVRYLYTNLNSTDRRRFSVFYLSTLCPSAYAAGLSAPFTRSSDRRSIRVWVRQGGRGRGCSSPRSHPCRFSIHKTDRHASSRRDPSSLSLRSMSMSATFPSDPRG